MRVALLTSEAVPFAKTGGLADVTGALPKALREEGADALLVMPLFEQIERHLISHLVFDNLDVEWRVGTRRRIQVWYSEAAGAPAFLLDAPEYFARPSVYGFRDDHERYAFFCRAALALFKRLDAPPDVVHGNDWPCGFASVELRARRALDSYYARTRTLFSIHNLAYQGAFDPSELDKLGFGAERDVFMINGSASALKAALLTSDALSTVSHRYALEIQTAEHGHGLDWILRARRDRLFGITNGVDYDVWNPATDKYLPAHYDTANLDGKRICKRELLRRFNLPEDMSRPLIANISRLTAQKGYDLIKESAGAILETGAFFIALGSGAREYEDFLQAMRDHAPAQVGVYKGFNEPLAHLIEAGADIFLMPSLYEPCGLNQMYSTRYGTVPVVRATGGLDDTVSDFDRVSGNGNGFKFAPYTPAAMLEKIHEALYCYSEPETWHRIQLNGMRVDNSWRAVAQKYLALYRLIAET